MIYYTQILSLVFCAAILAMWGRQLWKKSRKKGELRFSKTFPLPSNGRTFSWKSIAKPQGGSKGGWNDPGRSPATDNKSK